MYVSVYRKLRSGSVKSSALNGTGQTYAETSENRVGTMRYALFMYFTQAKRKTYKTAATTTTTAMAAITRDSICRIPCIRVLTVIYIATRLVGAQ